MAKGSGGGGAGVAEASGTNRKSASEKAAERFGVAHTAEFATLYKDSAFRDELDQLRQQAYEVSKGWRKESETKYGRHGLTAVEYAAMQVYSSNKFSAINNTLRGVSDASAAQKKTAKAYESAVNRGLGKLNKSPGVAYRGIGNRRLAALGDLKPGDTFRDKGFASSSRSQRTAKGFGRNTIVIRHKNGRDFSKVVGGGEAEILFKSGTRFRVRTVRTRKDGSKTITVEEA